MKNYKIEWINVDSCQRFVTVVSGKDAESAVLHFKDLNPAARMNGVILSATETA